MNGRISSGESICAKLRRSRGITRQSLSAMAAQAGARPSHPPRAASRDGAPARPLPRRATPLPCMRTQPVA